jgi:transcriptional regulator with XRE-family HTH domain
MKRDNEGERANMCWWVNLGYPVFEEGKGGFPRTGQVVKHYRENTVDDEGNAWTQKRLAKLLDVTEKTIGEIENRDAVLDFDRRQRLTQLFDIPSLLLGIRTREEILKLVEQHQAKNVAPVDSTALSSPQPWWVELGYSAFAVGRDGFFPRTGQVIKHYRGQKKDDKGKPWTQRLLAQTLGLTDQAVWDLENRDIGMDFDRRQFLSDLFAIPPVLLGIVTVEEIDKMVEEHRAAHKTPPIVSTANRASHKLFIDLEEYTTLLEDSWATFISGSAHLLLQGVSIHMDALYRELPHVREKKPIYALLCRYHDFVANVLRDQQRYDDAIVHCNKGLRLAKRVNKEELTALMLYEWGSTLWEADRLDEAKQQYEEARRDAQQLPNNLRGCLLLDIGCLGTLTAQTKDEKREAIALVDRVGSLVSGNLDEYDPYFLHFNFDRYHLTRGLSLIIVGRNRDAIEELRLVKAGSEYPRRQALSYIYQAQAHLNLGKYGWVIDLAESGLLTAQEINSKRTITRVEKLYQQLKESSYKDSSDVARLDYLLRAR